MLSLEYSKWDKASQNGWLQHSMAFCLWYQHVKWHTHIVNEIDLKCSWIELSHFQLVCKHFCGRYGLGCVISVLLNIVSQKRFIWHSFKCMTATAATSSPPPPSPLHSERTDIWISVVARALNKMYDYLTNEEIRTCGQKRM